MRAQSFEKHPIYRDSFTFLFVVLTRNLDKTKSNKFYFVVDQELSFYSISWVRVEVWGFCYKLNDG